MRSQRNKTHEVGFLATKGWLATRANGSLGFTWPRFSWLEIANDGSMGRVCIFSLHEWLMFFMVNVVEYTIQGSYGI